MTDFKSDVECRGFRGVQAGIGDGYTLETIAVRLAEDIAELRDDGGLPLELTTVVTVLPQARALEVTAEGLSVAVTPTAPRSMR